MNGQVLKFPVHIERKHGLSPPWVFVIWAFLVGNYYLSSVPGYHATMSYRVRITPTTHSEFVVIAVIITLLALFSLLPVVPMTLDMDERGIRMTIIRHEHFYAWSDIADIRVTAKGGFRGRGGAIRFIRRGQTEPRKPVDLAPGMFGGNAADFSALIREGIARWGGQPAA